MKRTFTNLLALAALLLLPALASAQSDSCAMTINGYDSYGDGWNGGTVTVYQNGVQITSFTIESGSEGSLSFNVGSDSPVQFVYTAGSYSSENTFTVSNGFGELVYSSPTGNQMTSGDTCYVASVPCPSCAAPTALVVSDITNNGATLSWTPAGEESSWIVRVNGEAIADSPVSEPTVTLSDYDANTLYNVEILTPCDDGNTSSALSGSFRTLCENGNCEITIVPGSQYGSYYGPSVNVIQGGSVLASVSGSEQTVEICNLDSLYIVLTGAGSYSPTVTVIDAGESELFSGSTSSYTVGDTLLAVASACPTCMPVAAVHADSVGSYDASITWTDMSIDGIGDYAIYLEGELVDYVYGDTVYQFTGLSASTSITVGVARICEEGDTAHARTITFRTDCGAVTLPYYEDFEGLGFTASNGMIVPCWVRNDAFTSTTSDGRTFPCGSTSGDNATMGFAANEGDTIFIATDTIPVAGDSVFVSFRAQPNGNVDFWCGVMSDPNDTSTFIPIGSGIHTTNGNNTWGEYLFSTVGFSSDVSYRVAFKYCSSTGFSGNWLNLDDIEIRVFDGCVKPTEVAVDEVTTESAVLDWHVNGTEDTWIVAINDEEPFSTQDKPYTLEGLEANTLYTVRVAAQCLNGDTTQWSEVTFRTPCAGDTCVVMVSTYGSYSLIQNGYAFENESSGTYNTCYGEEIYLYGTDSYSVTVANAAGIELYNGSLSDLADTVNLGQPCPSCMPATDLQVSDITADGATFTWTPMDATNVIEWIVYVDDIEYTTVSDGSNSAAITGLTANADHTLAVRANCGEEDSSMVRSTTFRTLCEGGNCDFQVQVTDWYGSVSVWQDGTVQTTVNRNNGGTVSLCLGSPITLTWNGDSYTYDGFSISKGDSSLLYISDASDVNTGDTLVVFDGSCNATVYDIHEPIIPGSCDDPTSLTATATETTIDFSFSGTATDYDVEILEGNYTVYTWPGFTENAVRISTTSYTFEGLEPGTEYTIGVRAVCDEEEFEYSNVAVVTVSTEEHIVENCDAPVDVDVPEATTDSTYAIVHWTEAGSATMWQISLKRGADEQLFTTSNNPYTVSSLTPGATYYVKVRALCSATDTSAWSQSAAFQTPHGGTTPGDDTTGIAAVDELAVSLYPNPASDYATLEVAEPAEVTLVDLNGRTVYAARTEGTLRIELSQLGRGTYFVRIVSESGLALRKLVVK